MKLKKFKTDKVVKINSKEDYLLLMELAEKAGLRWYSGHNPTYFNDHDEYYSVKYIAFKITLEDERVILRVTSEKNVSNLYDVITMRKAVKFEVGDKVRIRKDLDKCEKSESPKIVSEMLDVAGNVYKISTIIGDLDPKYYQLDCGGGCLEYNWLKKWLEPVASCDAVETEQEKEHPKSEYFNGEVVCVNTCATVLTKGKVYKFVDGRSTYDDGDMLPCIDEPIKNVADLNSKLYSDFIEVSGRGEKLEGFTGKVVCTKSKNQFTTKGKIYEFVNGLSVDDDGDVMPNCTGPVESVEDLNDRLFSNFLEVVE